MRRNLLYLLFMLISLSDLRVHFLGYLQGFEEQTITPDQLHECDPETRLSQQLPLGVFNLDLWLTELLGGKAISKAQMLLDRINEVSRTALIGRRSLAKTDAGLEQLLLSVKGIGPKGAQYLLPYLSWQATDCCYLERMPFRD